MLLIDNVPQNTENVSKSSDEVNAVFISANTTSILLPIDQGVILISSLINISIYIFKTTTTIENNSLFSSEKLIEKVLERIPPT